MATPAWGTLVDSNVLLDVFTDDPTWADGSSAALARALNTGPVVINPLVYAELSIGFERIEELDDALPDFYNAAHAAVTGRALLTRDRPRHLELLPGLEVVAPE